MKSCINSGRSFERIDDTDLARLAEIAAEDRKDFFSRHPLYAHAKVLCVTLCQGAALHYVDGSSGVKDFDVWTFFERTQQCPDFPCRRRLERDFGESKFGKNPADRYLTGRRVDLIGRSIESDDMIPTAALAKYLSDGQTHSARHLSQKAVILLEPTDLRGVVVWPRREPNA